jgi:hypothetical protein
VSDLSLKQLQDFGINNFMSDKEIEKTLTKALEEQQTSLNAERVTKEQTLEDVLREGGDYLLKFEGKKYRIRVLTKHDMNLLDNASNFVEQGIEYDIPKPLRYHVKTAMDNYCTLSAKSYDEAQQVIDSIYSKGLYKVSCSVL